MPENPTPDEFGRYRVIDQDTGHKRSIVAAELPHGRYQVVDNPDEPASDRNGDPTPPEYNAVDPTPVEDDAPAAAPSGETGGDGDDSKGYDDQKVEQLQAEADKRGLEVTGTGAGGNVIKPDLVAALKADDDNHEENS